MAKYLARTCPKCGNYLGIVIGEAPVHQARRRGDGLNLKQQEHLTINWEQKGLSCPICGHDSVYFICP